MPRHEQHRNKRSSPTKKGKRGWGKRLKSNELREALSPEISARGNARTSKHKQQKNEGSFTCRKPCVPVANVGHIDQNQSPSENDDLDEDEDIDPEGRLSLLHKEYFRHEKDVRVMFRDIGLKSIIELKKVFNNYDRARSKSNQKTYAPTAHHLATLLGINDER